jgi:hypothetical protein
MLFHYAIERFWAWERGTKDPFLKHWGQINGQREREILRTIEERVASAVRCLLLSYSFLLQDSVNVALPVKYADHPYGFILRQEVETDRLKTRYRP